MPEHDVTVGTEAMSDRARPRSLEGVRLVEEGRRDRETRRFPALPQNSSVLRIAWWTAKCRAVAHGEHVSVLEGVPVQDASAIDGEAGGCGDWDGPRLPINNSAMQEATLEVQARRKLREIEEWARGLLEGEAE